MAAAEAVGGVGNGIATAFQEEEARVLFWQILQVRLR
jgi:hypothetical protein